MVNKEGHSLDVASVSRAAAQQNMASHTTTAILTTQNHETGSNRDCQQSQWSMPCSRLCLYLSASCLCFSITQQHERSYMFIITLKLFPLFPQKNANRVGERDSRNTRKAEANALKAFGSILQLLPTIYHCKHRKSSWFRSSCYTTAQIEMWKEGLIMSCLSMGHLE